MLVAVLLAALVSPVKSKVMIRLKVPEASEVGVKETFTLAVLPGAMYRGPRIKG